MQLLTGDGAPTSTPVSVGSVYHDMTNDVYYYATGTSSSSDWSSSAYTSNIKNVSISNTSGGTANGTIEDVGETFDQDKINNNFTELYKVVNAMRAALVASGLMNDTE
jgi:hypothetical protein